MDPLRLFAAVGLAAALLLILMRALLERHRRRAQARDSIWRRLTR